MEQSADPQTTATIGSVFAAKRYRQLLNARLAEHRGERGYQQRVADAAGCRSSYLSQVIHSHIQLTLDQAAGIAEFWGLSKSETEYFLALVGSERSRSPALRRHLDAHCAQLREENQRLSRRVKSESIGSEAAQAHYYTSWYLPAIHVLLGNPQLRTVAAISSHLRLPAAAIQQSLEQLVAMGLAEATPLGYQASNKGLHLSDTSPFLSVYHANWRQQAAQRVHQRDKGDAHFTGLYAVGPQEAAAIRELIMDVSTRSRSIAAASSEEGTALCVLFDFFTI